MSFKFLIILNKIIMIIKTNHKIKFDITQIIDRHSQDFVLIYI